MHTVIIKLTLSINFRKVNKHESDPNEYLTQSVCLRVSLNTANDCKSPQISLKFSTLKSP